MSFMCEKDYIIGGRRTGRTGEGTPHDRGDRTNDSELVPSTEGRVPEG